MKNTNSSTRPGLVRLRFWNVAAVMLPALAGLMTLPAFAQKTNIEAGRQIAAKGTPQGVAACSTCHGPRGEGMAVFPRLAGSGQAYLLAQLTAFGNGSRKNPVMQPMAEKLSPAERVSLAAYYSQLPAPFVAATDAAAEPSDAGAWLATRGRWADQVPACTQCHGPGGNGVGQQFPPLAGLPAGYITAQLQAWKTGDRPPGPQALMQQIAQKLTAAEITAVSSYYEERKPQPGAKTAMQPSGRTQAVASPTPNAASAPVALVSAAAAASSAAKPTASSAKLAVFSPPPESSLPQDDFGKVVKRGEQIFMETGKYAGRYVGNNLSCANCHLDAGRQPDSAPMWAAFIHYPAYRKKTGQVDTLASRIQGCFDFSMNGKAPPANDEVMTALQTYFFWLAKAAPVGMPVAGGGYLKLKKPPLPADYARGEAVYTQNCVVCHGANGQGQRVADKQVFPPLWGAKSYNWGAGMHQLANSSGFIKANMPLGQGGSLSDQAAWDVALFMNSHERPQDPRFKGSVAATRKAFHDTDDSLYGTTVNGRVLGGK